LGDFALDGLKTALLKAGFIKMNSKNIQNMIFYKNKSLVSLENIYYQSLICI
jgi:hypothetical protein